MKRNLLLLTAVVLAAVIMSGCVMWPFGVAVEYDVDKEIIAKHDGPKRVSKEGILEVNFTFAEDADAVELDKSVKAGTKEFTDDEAKFEVLEDVLTLKIPNVGKEKIKITVKAAEVDPEL
ncbi:MAG TPA: hypothetical protein VJZ70_04070 [Limnochordia bacterium]|nr:hypothetical protein [Limnochordia bacterium]